MSEAPVRVVCDAMCGGLARWLRALGCDASYRDGIDDPELVDIALAEGRVVITSDGKLLERRVFQTGRLRAVPLPRGLKLSQQVEYVARALALKVGAARCTLCNGELAPVTRSEVADVVPARSLIWAREFFRCAGCGHVFWDGTHWRRIDEVRRQYLETKDEAPTDAEDN